MLWTLLGILLTASTVQAQTLSDGDPFQFFNACRPMMLKVVGLSSYAQEIGLTKERIQLAAESRLRVARLYTDSEEKANFASLNIRIDVGGHAANIKVMYMKLLTDLATSSNGRAITWYTYAIGPHGGNAARIIQHLSSLLDGFLVGYLRVNESACDRR